VDWCYLDSIGASSGVLIMWDSSMVDKINECVGEFSLVVS
jgi:hypothetical protein